MVGKIDAYLGFYMGFPGGTSGKEPDCQRRIETRKTVDQKSTGFRRGSWIKRESLPFPRVGAHLVLSPYFAGEPPPRPDLRNLKSREYLTKLKSWRAFLVAQTVKNPAAVWETWV